MTATNTDMTSSRVPPHAAECKKTTSVCLTVESKKFPFKSRDFCWHTDKVGKKSPQRRGKKSSILPVSSTKSTCCPVSILTWNGFDDTDCLKLPIASLFALSQAPWRWNTNSFQENDRRVHPQFTLDMLRTNMGAQDIVADWKIDSQAGCSRRHSL